MNALMSVIPVWQDHCSYSLKPVLLPLFASSQRVNFGRILCYFAIVEKSIGMGVGGGIHGSVVGSVIEMRLEKGRGVKEHFPKVIFLPCGYGPIPLRSNKVGNSIVKFKKRTIF